MIDRIRKFLDDVPLHRKGTVILSVPVIVVFLTAIMFLRSLQEASKTTAQVTHTLQVKDALNRYRVLLLEGESALRGFVLSQQNRQFFDLYNSSYAQLPAIRDELTSLVMDNALQTKRIRQLEKLTIKRRDFQEQIIHVANTTSDTQELDISLLVQSGNEVMEDIRKVLIDLHTEEDSLLVQRREFETAAHRQTYVTVAIALVLGLLGGSIASLAFASSIGLRIAQLDANAKLLENDEPLNPPPSGKDEIGRLGLALDTASKALTARREEIVSARDELEQLNAQLEQRLEEVQSANAELEAFTYTVSHDLRAPLRHVAGFSDLLVKHATDLDEKSARYLGIISSSVRQMGTLIDELLAFSRMGRSELKQARVDLNEVVAHVLDELEPQFRGRDIEWKIGKLPIVSGDANMLTLVMQNLIENAIKYTGQKEHAVIEVMEVPQMAATDEILVQVRDNGAGFDMEYRDKLFGVFQRLHRAEAFTGNGIGLASVKRIIQRHGGRVDAVGVENEGSTFTFTLPVGPRETSSEHA